MWCACASAARRVFVGHEAENLGAAEVVVVSTAIKRDNPELIAAREKRLPVVRRAEMLAELMRLKRCDRDRRHARQDDDDLARRGAARRRRARSDRHQRRHHQRLWHQRAARRGRLDGRRGRRERRHVPQAAGRRRHRHQHRSRASRSFRARSTRSRTRSARFVENLPFYGFAVMCLDHPDGAGAGRPHRGSPRHHLWRESAGRRAAARRRSRGRRSRFNVLVRDRKTAQATYSTICACRCPAITMRSTRRRPIAVAHELGVSIAEHPQGARLVRRREAALHQDRRMEGRR